MKNSVIINQMNQGELERITKLETQMLDLRSSVGVISEDIKKIMRNDLPHLQLAINEKTTRLKEAIDKRMDKQDKKINELMLKVGIIITIGGVILNYLVNRFLP